MSENEKPERVAIVTGASSGIGEATAHCLAKAGFSVVLAARRADLLDSIVADINAQGGKALSVPTDLSDAEQTSALVQAALDAFGRVDVLVNNAGYGPPYALEQMDRRAMRHVFDVNLLSGMQLIAELTPTMREQGGGRIINISSLSRYVGAPLAAAYAATKGGMEALTACMRLELSPWNIELQRHRARVRRYADVREVSRGGAAPARRPEQPLPPVDDGSRRLCHRSAQERGSSGRCGQGGAQSSHRRLPEDPVLRP